jgi:LytS/YehU family sensor histidine kinase
MFDTTLWIDCFNVIRELLPLLFVGIIVWLVALWLQNEAEETRSLALQAQIERDRQQQLAQQSELRALRAQIEPHFLNNILNDLNSLIRTDPNKARRYVLELADFFRHTHKFARENTISLREESEQLQRYIELQGLGFEDKLQASIDICSHFMHFEVLPGCLNTLVENTIKHAFEGIKPPYQVHISADETDSEIILHVRDNGRGLSPERMAKLGKTPVQSANHGGGVALYQLTQSLALEFGDSAGLKIESGSSGTTVSLTLPKRSKA